MFDHWNVCSNFEWFGLVYCSWLVMTDCEAPGIWSVSVDLTVQYSWTDQTWFDIPYQANQSWHETNHVRAFDQPNIVSTYCQKMASPCKVRHLLVLLSWVVLSVCDWDLYVFRKTWICQSMFEYLLEITLHLFLSRPMYYSRIHVHSFSRFAPLSLLTD